MRLPGQALDRMAGCLFRNVLRGAPYLPEGVFHGLGTAMGTFYYLFSSKKRQRVRRNLGRVLELDRVEESLVWGTFQNLGQIIGQFIAVEGWDEATKKERLTIVGKEHLERALAKDRGAVLALGHIGNWEMIPMILSLAGYEVSGIVKEQTMPEMDRLLNAIRGKRGLHTVPKRSGALRQAYRALQDNHVLLILMDEYGGTGGYTVPFCGIPTSTSAGAAVLSRRTGAPCLKAVIRSPRRGFFELHIRGPVPTQGQEVEDILMELNAFLQEEIKANPRAWYALMKRWRGDTE